MELRSLVDRHRVEALSRISDGQDVRHGIDARVHDGAGVVRVASGSCDRPGRCQQYLGIVPAVDAAAWHDGSSPPGDVGNCHRISVLGLLASRSSERTPRYRFAAGTLDERGDPSEDRLVPDVKRQTPRSRGPVHQPPDFLVQLGVDLCLPMLGRLLPLLRQCRPAPGGWRAMPGGGRPCWRRARRR